MQQLAETYAAEIGTLFAHRFGGRRSILATSKNVFATATSLAAALVDAALDLAEREPSLSGRFTTAGGQARGLGLSESTLLGDVSEMLTTTSSYLQHAAPALSQTPNWYDLWLAVNESAVRAAMYGYTRHALSFHSQATEDHLPPIRPLRRSMFPTQPADPDQAVVCASERLDLDGDAVIGSDNSGTILYWSNQAENRYGRDRQSALGMCVLDVTPTAHSRASAESILRGVARGEPWSGPFLVRDRTGNPRQVQRTDMPVQQSDRIVGVVGLRRFS